MTAIGAVLLLLSAALYVWLFARTLAANAAHRMRLLRPDASAAQPRWHTVHGASASAILIAGLIFGQPSATASLWIAAAYFVVLLAIWFALIRRHNGQLA